MEKKLVIVLVGIILIGSQSIIGANTINIQKENENRSLEWVIMIYLNGDNALSAAQGVILDWADTTTALENSVPEPEHF